MTHLVISDELAARVQVEAMHRGCTSDDLIELFVAKWLEEPDPELTLLRKPC